MKIFPAQVHRESSSKVLQFDGLCHKEFHSFHAMLLLTYNLSSSFYCLPMSYSKRYRPSLGRCSLYHYYLSEEYVQFFNIHSSEWFSSSRLEFHAHVPAFLLRHLNLFIENFPPSLSLIQFKYLDKDEFKDLKYLRRLHLDGNQLSVIVDYLFQRQKNLLFLGEWLMASA